VAQVSVAAILRPAEAAPVRDALLSILLGGGAFGAAVGSYVGGAQIFFAAVKMPMFLLGTLAICLAGLTVVAGSSIGAARAAGVAVRTVALTAILLGALSPPLALLGLTLPKPESKGYSAMVLALTAAVGVSGSIAAARLCAELGSRRLAAAWLGIYAFTGAQAAWLLKPWIGYTLRPDRFLPLRENLHGNFYEGAWNAFTNLLR
jgi:hypothetical protein